MRKKNANVILPLDVKSSKFTDGSQRVILNHFGDPILPKHDEQTNHYQRVEFAINQHKVYRSTRFMEELLYKRSFV